MRRMDRAITDLWVLKEHDILHSRDVQGQCSLSRKPEPRLRPRRVTKCLYFHCAPEGKKLDYMQANPHVWGQAIIDHGYVEGKCNHLYVTAMFEGTHLAESIDEKRRIMEYLFVTRRLSPTGEVDPHKTRIGKTSRSPELPSAG